MSEEFHAVEKTINDFMNSQSKPLQFGYYGTGNHASDRNEGDVWEDTNGKKWTKKDGIIQSISKLDFARTPLFCPVCESAMSHRIDTKFWRLRNKCMGCVVKEETKMRKEGTWEAYEKENIRLNHIAILTDKIIELREAHDSFTPPEYILADEANIMMIEKWEVDIEQAKSIMMKDILLLEDTLAKVISGELYNDNNTE